MATNQWTQYLIERESKKHEFSSTQFNFPQPLASEIISWGRENIPNDELFKAPDGGMGREREIHVTTLYGLHADEPDEVQKLLKEQKPFYITLGKTSVFTNNMSFDVVKIDVTSKNIHDLNKLLKKCEHTATYPNYHPHVTIAYVKKGKGWQHGKADQFDGESIKVDHIIFSSRMGKKTKIALKD